MVNSDKSNTEFAVEPSMFIKSSGLVETKSGNPKKLLGQLLEFQELSILIPLIALFAFFSFLKPNFLSFINVSSMLTAIAFIGVIAVGQTFLIITGEFDLSVGSVAGLSAIVCAYLLKNGFPFILAVVGGILAGGLAGLINAVVVVRFGIPAFIGTLGMLYMARGASYLISKGYPIYPLPKEVGQFGQQEPLGLSWAFLIFLGLVILGDLVLRFTSYGRTIYATGGNKEVAKIAGINVTMVKTSAFVLVGMLAGLGGILLMSRLGTGQPTTGQGWELNVIAGVVIGGVSLLGGSGSVAGTFIGLLILQVVSSGLVIIGLDPNWQTLAIGLIMILAVGGDLLRRRTRS